jgi:hypothetical protein
MRLPNAEKAVIERRKLTEYLLSETHPAGRFKAQFFKNLGSSEPMWSNLRNGCGQSLSMNR